MFVGEAPTSLAQFEDRPFPPRTGTAGGILQSWLDYLHLNRDEVYLTNVVKCPVKRRVLNSTFDQQVRVCTQWLDQEINETRSKLIVALGEIARKRFSNGLPGRNYSVYSDVWEKYPSAGK